MDNQRSQVTPPGEPTDAILHQMEETRTDLTKKVEMLENKVVGTVENLTTSVSDTVSEVKEAVQDTVGTVKETVTDTVDSVKETVRDATDVTGRVQRSPWLMVGGAAVAGLVAGLVLFRDRRFRSVISGGHQLDGNWPHSARNLTGSVETAGHSLAAAAPPSRAEPKKPGWFDGIKDTLGSKFSEEVENLGRKFSREIADVEDLAVATVAGVLKQMVAKSVPRLLGQDQEGEPECPPAPRGYAYAEPGATAGDPTSRPKRGNGRAQYTAG